MTSDFSDRFSGIVRLYGAHISKLQEQHVCIVGLGGVGSWAAEAIVRSGVGKVTLIDLDDVCVSNTNRQSHALMSNVGKMKAEVLAERFKDINPTLRINTIIDFVTTKNLNEYITTDCDFVLDAIDSATPKAAMLAHCKRQKIPVVTTGAAGGQIDPTKITVADINKTTNDPLAKKVRSLLRRHYGFSRNSARSYGIPCVFSTEQLKYPQPDGTVCQQKSVMDSGVRLDCAGGFGAATMVTSVFGMVAAAKVIEKLSQKLSKETA